jgi:hypothetical protein
MRRPTVRASLVLLLFLAGYHAAAVTLYVKRVVVVEKGALVIGDLLQKSGEIPPALARILSRRIGAITENPVVIPAGTYRAWCEEGLEEGLILVGKRTLVVPKGAAAEQEMSLLDSLVDFLESQGGMGEGMIELETPRIYGAPRDGKTGDPIFRVMRMERKEGLFSGPAEIGFIIPVSSGGSRTGRMVFGIRQDFRSGAAVAGVKAYEPVAVFFHKGSITIRMEGKALAEATEGGRVSVFVPESRKRFSGIVMADKAVSVEIP